MLRVDGPSVHTRSANVHDALFLKCRALRRFIDALLGDRVCVVQPDRVGRRGDSVAAVP